MRSLAEYIVSSSFRAAVVVALATSTLMLSWVGAAALALYTLRFGLVAAAPVFVAAMIPAAFWLGRGDVGPLLTHLGALLMAQLLRVKASWPLVLTALPLVMASLCGLLLLFAPDYVQVLQAALAEFVEQFKAQLAANNPSDAAVQEALETIQPPTSEQLVGMLGLLQAATVLLSLMLGRWWQSILFNPGGFREEFHALRMQRVQVLLLVACFVLLLGQPEFATWGWLFIFSLAVAGIAMVHGLVGIARGASGWLWLFYLVLLMLRPALGILVALAVMDSALDFRGRLRHKLANGTQ